MAFDAGQFLTSKGIDYERPAPMGDGGTKYRLKCCPFCESPKGSAVFSFPDKPIGFDCKHDRCQGKTGRDFVAKVGLPPLSQLANVDKVFDHKRSTDDRTGQPVRPYVPGFVSAADLAQQYTRTRYLVRDCVVAGQNLIMGGPQKAMKTSVALDLVISVSSGVPFLNMFEVPRACPVAFVSGESGNATLREAAMAIAVSKRVRLSTELYLSFALPSLAIEEHLAVLENEIVEKGLGLMIVDPAYLALLDSVSSTVSPSSVFAMGPILRHYAEIGDRTGCTMALIHHTKKGMKTGLRLTLDDLSQAGFAEFARQWFLINRRAVLTDNTPHRLICTVGGSAGHFGHYDVDALDMREHVGRVWEVTASESTEESKKAKWVDNAKRRLVDALRSGPKTRTDLKNRFKRFDEPLQALLDEGEVILTEVIKNKRSYDAYALPVQTPESQFGETENV